MANGNQQPTFAGQKVSPAMARAVSAFSASLEAEGKRRSSMGLSGAGFAAGFKEAMSPIIDYSDMMEGNAAPGTVLFDAAMKSAEDKNKELESKGIDSKDKAFEVDDGDEDDAPSVDPLGLTDLPKSGPEDKPAVEAEAIKEKVKEGMLRGTTGGPSDPLSGLPYDVLAEGKSYRLPSANTQAAALRYTKPVSLLSPGVRVSITEEEAMRRKEISRSDPNTLPKAMQPTGVGDTAYRSIGQASGAGLTPMPGTPFVPGQSVGGRAVPAR